MLAGRPSVVLGRRRRCRRPNCGSGPPVRRTSARSPSFCSRCSSIGEPHAMRSERASIDMRPKDDNYAQRRRRRGAAARRRGGAATGRLGEWSHRPPAASGWVLASSSSHPNQQRVQFPPDVECSAYHSTST
ncbi:hypothetical protein KIN20_010435 [Parelaphostrongylus tenuis]|uniref:Uncharacterized protein n=1 Tax=Parelaphostrongylus tenuis TaxID=148309 RepID=A0AAD5MQN6_PARTN|nr:hypothetical protein KIN20_010435 [Parelaphostrongylus tenuis]